MLRKPLAILTIILFTAGAAYSQDQADSTYKNALKVNIAAAALKKVTLNYQRQINSRWSAQLSAGYKLGGGIPKFIGLGDFVISSETRGIRGFSVSPEVRFHFKNCDCGDWTGLYAGAYMNATKLYGEVEFNYWTGTEYVDLGAAGSLQEYGIGLELGYQFVFKDRFVVDLLFMGPRTSFQRLKVGFDSNFAEEIIPKLEEEINERLEWWGMDPITIEPDANAVVDFNFNNFRYAISFGFLF